MTPEFWRDAAEAFGFSHSAVLRVSAIRLLPEVREMCAMNRCGRYGACWTCPPGCGDLPTCQGRLSQYESGILVQTVGRLEEGFDYPGMLAAEERHYAAMSGFLDRLLTAGETVLPLGAGGCRICKRCAYPDGPCRFPKKAFSSMEAYGMLVTDVCRENGLSYFYGNNTVAFTGCYLFQPGGGVLSQKSSGGIP